MNLNEKLTSIRKKEGYSQEEAAERLNVTRQTISNWETGQTSPSIEQSISIAKLYKISLDELTDNDIRNVIENKVSNTEKISGYIMLYIKFIAVLLVVLVIIGILCALFIK